MHVVLFFCDEANLLWCMLAFKQYKIDKSHCKNRWVNFALVCGTRLATLMKFNSKLSAFYICITPSLFFFWLEITLVEDVITQLFHKGLDHNNYASYALLQHNWCIYYYTVWHDDICIMIRMSTIEGKIISFKNNLGLYVLIWVTVVFPFY